MSRREMTRCATPCQAEFISTAVQGRPHRVTTIAKKAVTDITNRTRPRRKARSVRVATATKAEGLSPQAVLGHPTKLSNLLRDLTVGLRADVAVAEFGSLWDAEALGVPIDWSGGMPVAGKAAAPRPPADPDFANSRRGAVVLEALKFLYI
jgi:hypothetical protein